MESVLDKTEVKKQ